MGYRFLDISLIYSAGKIWYLIRVKSFTHLEELAIDIAITSMKFMKKKER